MNHRSIAAGAALGASITLGLLLSPEVRAVAAALVSITNTAANPVPVRQADLLDTFGTRVFPSVGRPGMLTVRADKRLVITSITGFNNSGLGSDIEAAYRSNGVGMSQRIPFHTPYAGGLAYLENANVHLVVDAGTTVGFYLTSRSSGDTGGYNIDVKGYYVDAN